MKKSNEEMKNNPNNYNIEVEDSQEEEPKIELDIAMGVLEAQKPKEIIPQDIIDSENNAKETITEGEKELVNFIIDKK